MKNDKITLEHDLLGSKEFDLEHARALLCLQEKRNSNKHPKYYIPTDSIYIYKDGYIKLKPKDRNTETTKK